MEASLRPGETRAGNEGECSEGFEGHRGWSRIRSTDRLGRGTGTASPAERAQAKCVSKAEYKAIQKGQGKAKVHQIVQNQKYSGDATEEVYGTCGWTMNNLAVSAITVRYKGGKVSGKSLVTGSVS